MAKIDFDSRDQPVIEAMGDSAVIPEGTYTAMIVGSEVKPTNSGDGKYVNLTFQVTGPKHAGKNIYHMFNTENPSEKTVQIGKGQLGAVCEAVGVLAMTDTVMIHNIPLNIGVRIKPPEGTYKEKNIIWKFSKRGPISAEQSTATAPPKTAPYANPGDDPIDF